MASKYMTNVELSELITGLADSIVSGLDFIGSVNEIYTSPNPPVTPDDADRIIFNNATPSGWDIDTDNDGTGDGVQPNDGDVLEYNATTTLWRRLVDVTEVDADGNKAAEGAFTWLENDNRFVVYTGTIWADFFGLKHIKDGTSVGSILSRNGYDETTGAIAASGLFSISLGDDTTVQSNYSTISGGQTNSINSIYSTHSFIGSGTNNSILSDAGGQYKNVITGGENNEISYMFISGILSGQYNIIEGVSGDGYKTATIVSGANNEITENGTGSIGTRSAILSGKRNHIYGGVDDSTICSGTMNEIVKDISFSVNENIIGSGNSNLIQNSYECGILSGANNKIYDRTYNCSITSGGGNEISSSGATSDTFYSAIVSGNSNTINAGCTYSFIGSGSSNTLDSSSDYSAIIAGNNNTINNSSNYNFIGAGNGNEITPNGGGGFPSGAAAIVGGTFNKIYSRDDYDFIGAGSSNVIRNQGYSAISAGSGNWIISGQFTSSDGTPGTSFYNGIVTGSNNKIWKGAGSYVFIGGGYLNTIEGDNAGTINNSEYSSIVGGDSNTITSSKYSTILGGDDNTITSSSPGSYGVVITGGKSNTINPTGDNHGNIISAGELNTIGGGESTYSGIFVGYDNDISSSLSNSSVILSGTLNEISGSSSVNHCAIVSGESNEISGTSISNNFIGSGYSNLVTAASHSSILGGYDNTINVSNYSAIVGGYLNTIQTNTTRSGILGGESNSITTSSTSCAIVSGLDNAITLSEKSAIVSGGDNGTGTLGNSITSSDYSIIGAGQNNDIDSSNYSFIGAGVVNEINGSGKSFIGSGSSNSIYNTSEYNVIGGGASNNIYDTSEYNVIGGGASNDIYDTSDYNVIGGGVSNNIHNNSNHCYISGAGNNIIDSTNSSILGTGNTINGKDHAFIFGGGITAFDDNATFVDKIYGRGGAYQFQHLYLSHTGNVINPKLLVTFDNTTNTINISNTTTAFTTVMYAEGTPIKFSNDGTLPSELDTSTTYYVINVSSSDFQISLTKGGSAVSFTDDGTPDTYITIESKNSFGTYLNEKPFLSKYDAGIGTSGGYDMIFKYKIKSNDPRQIDIIAREEYLKSNYSLIQNASAGTSSGGTLSASTTYSYIIYPVFLIDGEKYAARSHAAALTATTDSTNKTIGLQYDLHDWRDVDHIEIVRYDSTYGDANSGKLKILGTISSSINNGIFIDDGSVVWDDSTFSVNFAEFFRYGIELPEPTSELAGTVYEIQDNNYSVASADGNPANDSSSIQITCDSGTMRIVGQNMSTEYTVAFLDNEITGSKIKATCIFNTYWKKFAWLLDGDVATQTYTT